jgi:apolipoprotein N-acyltransferase
MNLNESDARLIQRLRRREESRRSTRWAALFVGSMMIGACAFLFQRIWVTISYDYILLMLCVLVAPALGVAFFLAVAAVIYVFLFWNGRPSDKLLLRLVDEVEPGGST